jgi:hypothetical protein
VLIAVETSLQKNLEQSPRLIFGAWNLIEEKLSDHYLLIAVCGTAGLVAGVGTALFILNKRFS